MEGEKKSPMTERVDDRFQVPPGEELEEGMWWAQ